jgi:uncharacterized protein (TIGR03083 family)
VHDDPVTTSPPRWAPEELLDRCVTAVVEEGERVGITAQELAAGLTPVSGGLQVEVPWVPGWTARDLVVHLGSVHRWVTGILRAGHTRPPAPGTSVHVPHDDLHGWYAVGLTELVVALRTVDPGTPTWHMSPVAGTALDWARRQAAEHLVHRQDLEVAAGLAAAPVDPELAGDGVDELLAVLLPRWAHTPPLAAARARVQVTATDLDRRWTVEVADGEVTATDGGTDRSDAQVGGTAPQLLLRLWGRPADVAVTGDPRAAALLRGR